MIAAEMNVITRPADDATEDPSRCQSATLPQWPADRGLRELIASLDAETQKRLEAIMASLDDRMKRAICQAVQHLDQEQADVADLIAIMKGKPAAAEIDEADRRALERLLEKAKSLSRPPLRS